MEILTSVRRLYISFKSLVNDFVYTFGRAALLLLVEVQNHTVAVRERGRIRVNNNQIRGACNTTCMYMRDVQQFALFCIYSCFEYCVYESQQFTKKNICHNFCIVAVLQKRTYVCRQRKESASCDVPTVMLLAKIYSAVCYFKLCGVKPSSLDITTMPKIRLYLQAV